VSQTGEAIGSPWLDAATERPRRALSGELEVDVAVVGAGIVGLTTARELQRRGATVAVLEAREVAAAASGNNTAKVSALQGLAYTKIAAHGAEAASVYARANEDGIALIGRLADEHSIDCSLRRIANYTFAEGPETLTAIERETEAARAAGLGVEFVQTTPLPFAVAGAVRLDDQIEFDPVAYLRGLADALDRGRQTVFEHSRALSISDKLIRTANGSVSCQRVVLATHLPTVDHVGLFARAEPQASFALAAEIPEPGPEGMFIDARGEHSIRTARLGERELLILAGQGHRLGAGDPAASLAGLRGYARDRFRATGFTHHWDAHDFVTEDRLPFVGSSVIRSDAILTATGMNKWGLALGSACGEMLAEAAAGEGRAWPERFDSRRIPRARSWGTLLQNGAKTGAHLLAGRLRRSSAAALRPGEGAVVGSGLGQRAAYRDEAGRLHQLSARCTHLGCVVAWNGPAKTWDCPCHGSRFAVDGSVLEGPAVAALERKESQPAGCAGGVPD
jgi:glycine/D-amino acid oxidase-like deaminating enzyme/nitrite reductase/ring-hydroxylating ferredoxin subunit